MKTSRNFILYVWIVLAEAALISGCTVQSFQLGEAQAKAVDAAVKATVAAIQPTSTPTASSSSGSTASNATGSSSSAAGQADLGDANVRVTLKTGMADGKMAFLGTGDLDGKVNPDIVAKPGDVVEITLEDGENIQHNLAIPDFKVQSQDVMHQGDQVKVKFKADKEGTFPYFCAIPGHRQAGMEGKLIVGTPTQAAGVSALDISRSPDDLPRPLQRTTVQNVRIDLEAQEVVGRLADGTAYTFWTYNGKVPGPFLRIRVGDTVEVHLKNRATNTMQHSVDFHAVTGPGGGAVFTVTNPGQETMFTFKALNPGLFVYHCATPMIPEHISNGMYGLILVEPENGLPSVDKEFYVMQGEIYTKEPFGTAGKLTFDETKLLNQTPEYYVLNGSVGALTALHPLQAKVGETIRIFFGVGGPNFISSFHLIGEIFDRVYDQASLTAPPLTDVQTTLVPPGGATVVEFKVNVPGRYILVDHALSRLQRGLAGYLIVSGEAVPEIFNGTPVPGSGH